MSTAPDLPYLIDRLFDEGAVSRRTAIEDRGLSNTKFRYELRDGSALLVRVNETLLPEVARRRFEKAKYCSDLCCSEDLPVPKVLRIGSLENGRPFSIEAWVSGAQEADLVREENRRVRIWENLGKFAASLHGLNLNGNQENYCFGFRGDGPTESWSSHLNEVDRIFEHDVFGFSAKQKNRCLARMRALSLKRYPLSLCHGDLKLDNVLVDPQSLKVLAVLDWEIARFAPRLLAEMSTSFEPAVLDNKKFSVARLPTERDAFMRGYGESWQERKEDFLSFYLSDIFTNLSWYHQAIYNSDRSDVETLKLRLKNYLDGVHAELESVRSVSE